MPCHLDLSAQTVRGGCPPNSQRASGSYHAHRDGKRGRVWVRAMTEGGMSALGHKQTSRPPCSTSAPSLKADVKVAASDVRYGPTAEVRGFTQSLRQREPAAMVAPYDRVGLAVRCAVVLSIPGHDQRWRFLSTSSARSACTVITNSLLITSSTVRSVSITNVTRRRGIIGIHPLTPNWRATT